MRNYISILIFLAVLPVFACRGSRPEEEMVSSSGEKWKLVWNDEFDYKGAPDPAKWDYDVGGHGWGNSEIQNYTTDRENSYVKNGKLFIKAVKTGKTSWTSARLKTQGTASWKYGRFEIRARQAPGAGTCTALWLLPEEEVYKNWPKSGEIDIAEHAGYDEGMICGTIRCDAYNHMKGNARQNKVMIEDAAKKFHVYAIEWNEDEIRWYIDDEEYYSFSREDEATFREWPFDQPFYLIMNLSIGGTWGGKEGIDKNMTESVMDIDYVRVYQSME